ncbi:MAG: plasmid recombination protein [Firmicutes bacterium]|nr:plasmid recombination protein [Bacillota bacterium]
MAHVAKYTKTQVGGLTRHFERAKKENGEYQNFKNQEIDITQTHLNYNLAPERNGGQLGFIKHRTSEVYCLNRADVNVMCAWVITAPKSLREHEYKRFFEEAYQFLNDRYAKGSDRNVISAYVHMDETTPHMHYAFVPVVWDSKKGIEKVSAKIAVHRRDLQSFHSDLEMHMKRVFGREIGILNEATKDGNRSIDELKKGTAQNELVRLQNAVTEVRQEMVAEIEQLEGVRDEKSRLEEEVKPIRELHRLKVMTEDIKIPEKTVLSGKTVRISREQIEILKEQADAYIANRPEIVDIRKRRKAVRRREVEVKKREDIALGWENEIKRVKKIEPELEQVRTERDSYKRSFSVKNKQIDSLKNEVLELEQEISRLEESVSELEQSNRLAYEGITNIVQAVGVLKYGNVSGYTMLSFTPDQSRLIDAVAEYGAGLADADGFYSLAERMKKSVRISEDILEIIDPPEIKSPRIVLPSPQRAQRDGLSR